MDDLLAPIHKAIADSGCSAAVSDARVSQALAATPINGNFVLLMNDYAKWNGQFAGGVAGLTALISRSEGIFLEPGFPKDLADRSTYIASFIFDAARDEYDDHINTQRDTHRTLAQAFLIGCAECFGIPNDVFNQKTPTWLQDHCKKVYRAYTGSLFSNAANSPIPEIFFGIGYHLGSEMLADREFTIIDQFIRNSAPRLLEFLKRKVVKVADADHRAYSWVGIHSGQGGGAEADHFAYGMQGAAKAIQYLSPADQEIALKYLTLGFVQFDMDHSIFFRNYS